MNNPHTTKTLLKTVKKRKNQYGRSNSPNFTKRIKIIEILLKGEELALKKKRIKLKH